MSYSVPFLWWDWCHSGFKSSVSATITAGQCQWYHNKTRPWRYGQCQSLNLHVHILYICHADDPTISESPQESPHPPTPELQTSVNDGDGDGEGDQRSSTGIHMSVPSQTAAGDCGLFYCQLTNHCHCMATYNSLGIMCHFKYMFSSDFSYL